MRTTFAYSLYFRSGVLAAALYNADTASLSVLSSVSELSPEFKMTKTLLHQVGFEKYPQRNIEVMGISDSVCNSWTLATCSWTPDNRLSSWASSSRYAASPMRRRTQRALRPLMAERVC